MYNYRVYNAGDRISEKMLIDNPIGHDNACKSFYTVDMPARDFFELPSEVSVAGHKVVADVLGFVLAKHPWVIQIDKNRENIAEAEQVATTDDKAVEKARVKWLEHLKKSAQSHIQHVQEMRSKNLIPPPAIGFAKRALDELGLKDPAAEPLIDTQKSTTGDELGELRKLLADQAKQIEALSKKQPAGANR